MRSNWPQPCSVEQAVAQGIDARPQLVDQLGREGLTL
jgi:hypothetical protein